MNQFPPLTPYLGTVAAFTINSPDPETSLAFYQKIGFRELMRSTIPFPFVLISDDALLIMLRRSDEPYLALTYYVADSDRLAGELRNKGILFASEPKAGDPVKRYLIQSPGKSNISLVETPTPFQKPPGRTMLAMEPSEYADPGSYTNGSIGMFGEFAEAVDHLDEAISFWDKLGFVTLSKYADPSPWAILSDGVSIIGLHQGADFDSTTITFFAADMKAKLEKLKSKGLEFVDMGGGNASLPTPEGQRIFLFSMGM